MGKVNEKEMTTLIMTTTVMEKLNSLQFVGVKVWSGRLGNKENDELFQKMGFF